MRVLHVDENHPTLVDGLEALGYKNTLAYKTPLNHLWKELNQYDGLIIRSRFPIDSTFWIKPASFVLLGVSGQEWKNIDISYAQQKGIQLFSAAEGNQNAVGEHCLGYAAGFI